MRRVDHLPDQAWTFFLRVNSATMPAMISPKISAGTAPEIRAVQNPVMPVTLTPLSVTFAAYGLARLTRPMMRPTAMPRPKNTTKDQRAGVIPVPLFGDDASDDDDDDRADHRRDEIIEPAFERQAGVRELQHIAADQGADHTDDEVADQSLPAEDQAGDPASREPGEQEYDERGCLSRHAWSSTFVPRCVRRESAS